MFVVVEMPTKLVADKVPMIFTSPVTFIGPTNVDVAASSDARVVLPFAVSEPNAPVFAMMPSMLMSLVPSR